MSILSTHYGISEETESFAECLAFSRSDKELRKDFATKVYETDEVSSVSKKSKKREVSEEVSAHDLDAEKTLKRRKDKTLKDKHYKRGAKGKTPGVALPVCELKKIQREMPALEYREKEKHGAFESPLQTNQNRRAQRKCNSKPKTGRSANKQKTIKAVQEELMVTVDDESTTIT